MTNCKIVSRVLAVVALVGVVACAPPPDPVEPVSRAVTYPSGFGPCTFGPSPGAGQVMLFSGASYTGSCTMGLSFPNGLQEASLGDFGPSGLGVRSLKQSLTAQGYTQFYQDGYYNLVWTPWCGCYLPNGHQTEYVAGTGNGVQFLSELNFLPGSLISSF